MSTQLHSVEESEEASLVLRLGVLVDGEDVAVLRCQLALSSAGAAALLADVVFRSGALPDTASLNDCALATIAVSTKPSRSRVFFIIRIA